MSQVNKYADRAAYASDTNRLSTLSAVSLIASGNELIYDGVNVVVGKDAAAAGDCAVYDKTAGAIRFVKGETLSAAQLPESLTPLAVVYARQGDKVLIVSLDNSTIFLWAASYEVALSGFDLPAGGTIVLKFADTYEKTITYTAGATLSDLAAAVNTALRTGEVNLSVTDRGGWSAAADEATGRVVLTSNGYAKSWTTVEAVSGATLTTRTDDTNYQVALTGLLLDEGQTVEYVRNVPAILLSKRYRPDFERAARFGDDRQSGIVRDIGVLRRTARNISGLCVVSLRRAHGSVSERLRGDAA